MGKELSTEAARAVTDTHRIHTKDNYSNPHACVPRVKHDTLTTSAIHYCVVAHYGRLEVHRCMCTHTHLVIMGTGPLASSKSPVFSFNENPHLSHLHGTMYVCDMSG